MTSATSPKSHPVQKAQSFAPVVSVDDFDHDDYAVGPAGQELLDIVLFQTKLLGKKARRLVIANPYPPSYRRKHYNQY